MRRRQFNGLVGGSVVAFQLGLLAGCDRDATVPAAVSAPGDADARSALESLAADLSGVEYVAPVCARRVASEDPLGELLASLHHDGDTLLDALGRAFAADFHSGNVVEIDGWMLSRSECLLLAGAAQLQGMESARRIESSAYRTTEFIRIERWGPDSTIEGEIFGPIGNGRGGFWLRVDGQVNGSMQLQLDGVRLATHFEPGVITASLDPEHMQQVIAKPGLYELVLLDNSRRLRQPVGFLTVAERPPPAILANGSTSHVFCQVGQWGPTMALAGEAFNRQPDGAAGFWVHVGCAPSGTILELAGTALPTSVQPGLITARVKHFATLGRGRHELVLFDPESGERLTVGDLVIQ